MIDLPLQPMVLTAAAIAFAVYTVTRRKAALVKQEPQYSEYRAGALAQRLGMTLVEGDPSFNLFITQAHAVMADGPRDGHPVEIRIRMRTQGDGIPIELVYFFRCEQDYTSRRTSFDCRMAAYPRHAFPPFEVMTRKPPIGAIASTLPLPPAASGVHAVDDELAITTSEPRLAQLLGQELSSFADFRSAGIHLVGDGKSVAFVMKQHRSPHVASALAHCEIMAAALERLARAVGG